MIYTIFSKKTTKITRRSKTDERRRYEKKNVFK